MVGIAQPTLKLRLVLALLENSHGASGENRTPDPILTMNVLYH